jgi:fibronectin-binding autotransporter adhesin
MNQLRSCTTVFLLALLSNIISVYATDYTWDGGHGTNFNESANWNPADVPNSSSDSAAIQNGGVADLSASNTVSTLTLGPGTLNLNSGGNLTTSQVIGTGTLGFSGGWLTASANSSNFLNTFNVLSTGGATIDTQSNNVTVGGSFVDLGGGISGGLTKQGAGQLTLTAANNYTGATTISGGVLQADDGVGLPANSLLRLDGGMLQTSSAMFTRSIGASAGNVLWTANGGGFSAGSASGLTINFGGDSHKLVWGTDIQGTLKLSSPTAKGLVKITNNIDLNGEDRVIEIDNSDTSMAYRGWISGVISNSSSTPAGIIKTGPGRLYINTANTYDGTTTVLDGFMAYAVLMPHGNYVVKGGVMCFCGQSPKITGLQVTGGGVEGLGTSIVYSDTTYDIQGGELYGITLSNGKDNLGNTIVVGLAKTGDTLAKLECTCNYTGPTIISAGTLELNTSPTTPPNKANYIGNITSSPIINTATFLIGDTNPHTVDTISGTGATQLNAGAQLTATCVEQGTLTIGAGATLTIAAIPGGPLSGTDSLSPVPEPNALLMLATAGLGGLAAIWRRKKH